MTKYVEWCEPFDDLGSANYLPVILRASVADIVKWQRRREPRYETDEDALADFIVVHWANVIETTEHDKT